MSGPPTGRGLRARGDRAARSIAAILALAFLAAAPVSAQEATTAPDPAMEGLTGSTMGPLADSAMEARATGLAAELRCPVCQGLSIQDSPSPLAQQMKDLIRTRVVAGESDEEIRGYFVSRYGEWVLLEPRAQGFNLVVYLLPGLALLGGLGLIVVAVRRWTEPVADDAPDGGAPG